MPVQTKTTIKIIALCMLVSASMMLSSCSTSNMLSQSPHYRLDLVKANKALVPVNTKSNDRSASTYSPISAHGSLASSHSDDQLKQLTALLRTNMKQIQKQTKKSNPELYKSLKNINVNKVIKQIATPRTNATTAKGVSFNRVNDQTYDLMKDPKGLFVIWILLLGAAIGLLLLASAASVFYLLGGVVAVAFLIFLFLWILSAAKVPERVS